MRCSLFIYSLNRSSLSTYQYICSKTLDTGDTAMARTCKASDLVEFKSSDERKVTNNTHKEAVGMMEQDHHCVSGERASVFENAVVYGRSWGCL